MIMKILKKGFTLVELVIVIAVIAILTAVLIPTFSGVIKNAQMSACLQEGMNEFKAAHAKDLSDGHLDKTEVMKINTEGWSIGYYVLEVSEGKLEARFRKSYKNDKYFVTFDGKEWNVSDEGEYIGDIIDPTDEIIPTEEVDEDGNTIYKFTWDSVSYEVSGSEGNRIITVKEFPADKDIEENTIIKIPAYINISIKNNKELVPVTMIDTSYGFLIDDPENSGEFELSYNIEEIKLPNTITEISEGSFYGCYNLTKINIPEKVKTIDDEVFTFTSLKEIKIPDSVTTIGDSAFYCASLKEIKIPDSVTTIGDGAFEGCEDLTKVSLPNNLKEIGIQAFSYCTSLTEITIPESVTKICEGAFEDCSALKNIIIPNSVTTIEPYAFRNCLHLSKITIPGSIEKIGEYAFYGCVCLCEIIIENGVKVIGDHAFQGCFYNELSKYNQHIYLSNTLTTIGTGAFEDCTYLSEIVIPNGVTELGVDTDGTSDSNGYVFQYCTNLTTITLPTSLTSFGISTFAYCESLKKIIYNGTLDQWCSLYNTIDSSISSDYDRLNQNKVIVQCTDDNITYPNTIIK